MGGTETPGAEMAETASQAQNATEALRRRIELYRKHLRGGVPGILAIAYLRQIADDEDQLAALTSRARAMTRCALGPQTRRYHWTARFTFAVASFGVFLIPVAFIMLVLTTLARDGGY